MTGCSSGRTAPDGRPWRCRDRVLALGTNTRVMGVVNVTPDSFSDGGRFASPAQAIDHALRLAAEGADILDIGGESTRPGAETVAEAEELRRILPVIEGLAGRTEALLSIDTTKAAVAKAALAAGAHIVNDVSALTADPAMAGVAAESGAGVVLMHRQGTPATMQKHPSYQDVVGEVARFLRDRADAAVRAGIHREALVLDPGIGFGKTLAHNLALLRGLPVLRACGYPVLVGASRKRMLGDLLGREVGDRLAGGLAVHLFAAAHGAALVRVHDVKETCDALRVFDTLTLHEE